MKRVRCAEPLAQKHAEIRPIRLSPPPAHPLYQEIEAVVIATFGHKVGELLGTIEHVEAPLVAGICVEHAKTSYVGAIGKIGANRSWGVASPRNS